MLTIAAARDRPDRVTVCLERRTSHEFYWNKMCVRGARDMSKPAVELVVTDDRLIVRGECDMLSAPEIETWLASFAGKAVRIDLSGVTFMDSSGLKVFLNARRYNSKLRVVESSSTVMRLLEMTGTHDYLVDGAGDL